MTYTTIHFVRHGEVHNPEHVLYERLPGYHLSDRGRRMAQRTAQYLAANAGPAQAIAVYSSPLERAQETAGCILDAINEVREAQGEADLTLRTDVRLIEAGNEFRGTTVGKGEGALWRHGHWRLMGNPFRPSWGESYRHIAERMVDFTYELLDSFADSAVEDTAVLGAGLAGDAAGSAVDSADVADSQFDSQSQVRPFAPAFTGRDVIVVSHESPIWCLRRALVVGKPEHNMLKRQTALASVTSFTFENESHRLLGYAYADPAKHVQ